MACTQLFFLKDEMDPWVLKFLLDFIGLMADDKDRLFGFQVIQGKVNRIGKHGNSQEGMEHLHEVRLHPSPFPGGQNNCYDAFQASILFERNFLFYTTFNAFSSTHYKIFSSPWRLCHNRKVTENRNFSFDSSQDAQGTGRWLREL